jgi:hypothetical protein
MSDSSSTFNAALRDLHYRSSVIDSVVQGVPAPGAYPCLACPGPAPAFPTSKALAQHMRIKHGQGSDVRQFAHADGRCRACSTIFFTRAALVGHLADGRRPRCLSWCREHDVADVAAVTASLDKVDKEQRRMAKRSGASHPIVPRPATKDGKVVGRTV